MTSSPLANQTNKRKIQDSESPVNSATIDNNRKKVKTNMLDIFVKEAKIRTLKIVASILYLQPEEIEKKEIKPKQAKLNTAIQEDKLAEIDTMMRNILSRLDNLELGTKKDKYKQVVLALLS
ncbi:11134_t:CDS:2 [Gigaspora margarita]|uniref:11134_t:CDS:1 n=1 Tax=Gigaspora margarita TaxID=4874 RepID=A0ABN7W271_GIGMA|nr:11134_t:CDS:2 [Gigaspora margarita]